jgi:hypothetical protein
MVRTVDRIVPTGMDYAIQALWVMVSWTRVVGPHEVVRGTVWVV